MLLRLALLLAVLALGAAPARAEVQVLHWEWKALESGELQVEGQVENTSEWSTEEKVELRFVGRDAQGRKVTAARWRLGRLAPGDKQAFRFRADPPDRPIAQAKLEVVGKPGEEVAP